MKKIIILFLSIFFLNGCSYVEINDLAIASALGIDYENNEFKLTAQILDIQSSESGMTQQKAIIYESSGPTIAKAVRNFSTRYPKNVYFGHLEFLVISDKASQEKLDDIFDFILRAPEVRSSSFVAITNNQTAKEILNPKNEKEGSFPTEEIKSMLMDATKRNGTVNDITFEEFLSFHLKTGIDPVIPLIKTIENKGMSSSSTIIEELVPIKTNKVFEPLDTKESIAYNTINNNYTDIVITSIYKSKNFSALIYNPNSSIEVKLESSLKVNINVNIESKINEIDTKIDLNNKKIHDEIKDKINKELREYINSLINYSKENNVDILGLGNMIYKNYNNEYKKYKDKNLYEIADFNIKINNKMYRHGSINKGAA